MNLDGGLTIECPVHFRVERKGRKCIREGTAPMPVPEGNVPRVTRLMALAIRFDGLLRRGEAKDYAELARLGRVTRARMTQIMNLLNLAPEIQEAILSLPRTLHGRDSVTERNLRHIVAESDWGRQRRMWFEALRPAQNLQDR